MTELNKIEKAYKHRARYKMKLKKLNKRKGFSKGFFRFGIFWMTVIILGIILGVTVEEYYINEDLFFGTIITNSMMSFFNMALISTLLFMTFALLITMISVFIKDGHLESRIIDRRIKLDKSLINKENIELLIKELNNLPIEKINKIDNIIVKDIVKFKKENDKKQNETNFKMLKDVKLVEEEKTFIVND